MVTGFGISKDVAEQMQLTWPTMGDFAAVKKQDSNANDKKRTIQHFINGGGLARLHLFHGLGGGAK